LRQRQQLRWFAREQLAISADFIGFRINGDLGSALFHFKSRFVILRQPFTASMRLLMP